jgi:WhiB family transcriptional regulator, redox-sensing transcriptional regulator
VATIEADMQQAEQPVGAVLGRRWMQQDWMADCACSGLTHLFFPPPFEREARRLLREAAARQICAGCPVIDECRTWAINNGELGFWGGQNDEERLAIRRRLQSSEPRTAQPRTAQAS